MEYEHMRSISAQQFDALPHHLILPTNIAIRQIQSVFPAQDITPFVKDLIDAFADNTQHRATRRMVKTIHQYQKALIAQQELSSKHRSSCKDAMIKTLDSSILMEQACFDILSVLQTHHLYLGPYFCFKFEQLMETGDIVLKRYSTLEEFYDFVSDI